jgi:hypothetical protein
MWCSDEFGGLKRAAVGIRLLSMRMQKGVPMKKPFPTPKDETSPATAPPAGRKNHTEELLDEALKETFPASDPPAMLEPAPKRAKSPERGKN